MTAEEVITATSKVNQVTTNVIMATEKVTTPPKKLYQPLQR